MNIRFRLSTSLQEWCKNLLRRKSRRRLHKPDCAHQVAYTILPAPAALSFLPPAPRQLLRLAPEAVLPTVIEAGFIPFAVSLLDQSNKSCSLIVLNFIQTLISVTDEALRKTIIEQLIESESIELVETWMSDPDIGQVADALYPLLEEAISS